MKLQLRLKPCLLAGIFSEVLPLSMYLFVHVDISHGQSVYAVLIFIPLSLPLAASYYIAYT